MDEEFLIACIKRDLKRKSPRKVDICELFKDKKRDQVLMHAEILANKLDASWEETSDFGIISFHRKDSCK